MVRHAEPSRAGVGRPRAKSTGRRRGAVASLVVVIAFLALFGVVSVVWEPPVWLPAVYLIASVVCFVVYAADKSAARAGGRRVPESTLLLLGLVGGWPGAAVAQQTLRHKTVKPSFRLSFWSSVVVNIGIFLVVASPEGSSQLLQLMR